MPGFIGGYDQAATGEYQQGQAGNGQLAVRAIKYGSFFHAQRFDNRLVVVVVKIVIVYSRRERGPVPLETGDISS